MVIYEELHNTKKGGARIEPVDLKERILTEFREGNDHELSLFADSFFHLFTHQYFGTVTKNCM